MRDHSKLTAFGLADQLALSIYRATQSFPPEEKYGLSSQLRRAAVSIAANIVEASARPSEREYVHLLTVTYASAKELQYEISLSVRLQYITGKDAVALTSMTSSVCKALYSLIRAINGTRPRRTETRRSGRSP